MADKSCAQQSYPEEDRKKLRRLDSTCASGETDGGNGFSTNTSNNAPAGDSIPLPQEEGLAIDSVGQHSSQVSTAEAASNNLNDGLMAERVEVPTPVDGRTNTDDNQESKTDLNVNNESKENTDQYDAANTGIADEGRDTTAGTAEMVAIVDATENEVKATEGNKVDADVPCVNDGKITNESKATDEVKRDGSKTDDGSAELSSAGNATKTDDVVIEGDKKNAENTLIEDAEITSGAKTTDVTEKNGIKTDDNSNSLKPNRDIDELSEKSTNFEAKSQEKSKQDDMGDEASSSGDSNRSSGGLENEFTSSSDVIAAAPDVMQSVYFLKRFKCKGEQIQIVTQNENGPCPLLAIANVLAITKRISLPAVQECITASQLMEYIGDYILQAAPKDLEENMLLNQQQNMHDAISIMHKLQTGIDVNVKFTGPRDFEFTSECLVFDLLNIGLYHGWLVDPQDDATVAAIGSLSYNQLVEKIIKSKESNASEDMISEGLLAESFLEGSASQLTYHGLCELNNAIREEELCVFFRNNHFGTLYKRQGELFQLVTDQGYLNQSRIIWETLANVDGAGQFVDESFHTVGPFSYPAPTSEPKPSSVIPDDQLTQEDRDYLIALSLQEESRASATVHTTNEPSDHPPQMTSTLSPAQQEANDLALAQRLQNEEQEFLSRQPQPQLQRPYPQQMRQPVHRFPVQQRHPPRGEIVGRETSDNRNNSCAIL